MTKIGSSINNDIVEKYIELVNQELEADNVNNLLQTFFKLLVKNSAGLKCESMSVEVKCNLIYGIINFTAIANDEEEFIKRLKFIFTTNYTNFCYKFDDDL